MSNTTTTDVIAMAQYREGVRAFELGRELTDNPNNRRQHWDEWLAWIQGYCDRELITYIENN